MLDIVCVKWGSMYGPEYVNILRDMVARNISVEHRFICFTDDNSGLDAGIETRPLPGNLIGWWNKLYLFSKQAKLSERVLFFDLDTVITGNIDALTKMEGFYILRDFYRHNGYGSGLMAWDRDLSYIWESYCSAGFPDIEGGDQIWIEKTISDARLWQDALPGKICSYKEHAQHWPPAGTSVVCFHGRPKPHTCASEWVKWIWKKNGLKEPELFSRCNTQIETLQNNIKSSCARKLPQVIKCAKPQSKHMVIIGGGPSLTKSLGKIRLAKVRGQHLWTVNGTHDWLIERNITPDFMAMLDARPNNIDFVTKPNKDVHYYIASQCDPLVYDALDGYQVTQWHSYQQEVEDLLKRIAPCEVVDLFGGGGTVILKLLYIGYALGYRTFHLYGVDSSFQNDKHHAYQQTINDNDLRLTVYANGKEFICTQWMLKQAQDYQEQVKILKQKGCVFHVHGDGLLPFIHSQTKQENQINATE